MQITSDTGSTLYLWFVCSAATLGGFLFGYDMVVVSGVISHVVAQFDLTSFQLGLLVSCVLWGCAIGSGIAGITLDVFGRKIVIIIASFTMFFSAIWCGIAMSPEALISARFLGGLGCGLASTASPLYISEVSPENIRGRMVSIYHFSVCFGIVICVFVNWAIISFALDNTLVAIFLPFGKKSVMDEYWRSMFIAEAFPAIIFMMSVIVIPESPRWLIKNDRISKAESILSKINGRGRARQICKDIKTIVLKEEQIKFFNLFTSRLQKPLALSVLICVFSEACGISDVLYYGPQLFEQAGLSLNDSLGGFIVIALILLFFNLVAMYFIDKVGRKKLLMVGSTGSMFSLMLIGSCYLTGRTDLTIVIFMATFVAFFASSIGPVKFVILSELFPNSIRGRAVSVATISIWLTSAAVAQLFPMMREVFHTGYIFYFFALDVAALLLVVVFLLPETKGRTIEEIEVSWMINSQPI